MLRTTLLKRATSVTAPLIQRASYTVASSVSSNGVRVAASEESSPVSSLSVVVGAGPRYEDASNLGVSSVLKSFAFKNTHERSAFRITREAELQGAQLSVAQGRESLVYSAEFLSKDLPYFVQLLSDVISQTNFAKYEYLDVKKASQEQSKQSLASPEVKALEALHSVAFRNGLGNSLYSHVGSKATYENLKEFVNQSFVGSNISVVGTGVQKDQLDELVQQHFAKLNQGVKAKSAATKYYGGESRLEAAGEQSTLALAFEGASLSSAEYLKLQVLRYIIGAEKTTKWGAGVTATSAAVSKVPGASASTFNIGYSDAGLFGILVNSSAEQAQNLTQTAIDQISKAAAGVSEEDLKRAVANAKFETAQLVDTRLGRGQIIGEQQLFGNGKQQIFDVIAKLDEVSSKDVSEAAKKVLSSKPTLVTVGNNHTLPYVDSFKF
ncbi:LuxS/MPP-like metallohydrolase [Basidiobolus meristosporus CBS 931.73]|uniref:Cytochrome b-c1 complex subunit 2, mitochondrial n=1 Tax=Basidiobolus meristosporus CBS 931.73 TaxID=1314790 RepID=A0A1Y1Y2K7_9FUNG|nr:LuxS/MPP-like metallohydrolase [Basidiobolus meristosporus CBS 931.73]|eukprot:ORX92209.1 LuxS/MPP-like metallohydrolase [Basidiobolus meristosporus CBS 931.73]